MKISAKGRYALLMMLDLAEHQTDGFIALKDVADRQGISKKYLEQIAVLLNRSDMLRTNRGSQGGYTLAKPAEKYTVGDVLRITEGSISPLADTDCRHVPGETKAAAMTRDVWYGLEQAMTNYLDHLTLQDVIDQHKETGQFDFHI